MMSEITIGETPMETSFRRRFGRAQPGASCEPGKNAEHLQLARARRVLKLLLNSETPVRIPWASSRKLSE